MAAKKQYTFTLDLEKLTPILFGLVIIMAFLVGILWQKVSGLESGGSSSRSTGTAAQPAGQPAAPSNGKLTDSEAERLAPVSDSDFVRGSRDAEVFIVEYSDLECPFCQQFHATAQQAVDEFDGQVAWVYRHFPLTTIHPRAQEAAIAAECVNQIAGGDAFWSFTDAVFASQQSALSDLAGTAEKIGVNKGQFESCLSDGSLASNVDEDYDSGITAGVTGTPGNFIVNSSGEVWAIPGAVPFSTLEVTIGEALGS